MYLFPTPGQLLRGLLDDQAQADEEFSEYQATADIMLALDRGDVKPIRYYAGRWAWSKSTVHRHMSTLKKRARKWRSFDLEEVSYGDHDGDQSQRGADSSTKPRDTGETERDTDGTSSGQKVDEFPAEPPLKGADDTSVGHQGDTAETSLGQSRDSIDRNKEQNTNTDLSSSPPAGVHADERWWFVPDRDWHAYRQTITTLAQKHTPSTVERLLHDCWGPPSQGEYPLQDLQRLLDAEQSKNGEEEGFLRILSAIVIASNESNNPSLKLLSGIKDTFGKNGEESLETDERKSEKKEEAGNWGKY